MSDYNPNPRDPSRDPRNYDAYYEPSGGKGLTLVVGILVAIALVSQLKELGVSLLRTYTGEKLVLGFRGRLFSHVQRLSLSYHDS